MDAHADELIEHCRVATMVGGRWGAIDDATIAIRGERIAWVGPRSRAPRFAAATVFDAGNDWITPGLVDCHTHLVYAGNRAHEFEMRLTGATYEEIARAGGGIASTVRATRAASDEALAQASARRLARMIDEGVTTVEIKSGYGLDTATETKLLRVARALGERLPVRTVTTLLAAHAVPAEYAGRADDYVALVCDEIVPAAARARRRHSCARGDRPRSRGGAPRAPRRRRRRAGPRAASPAARRHGPRRRPARTAPA